MLKHIIIFYCMLATVISCKTYEQAPVAKNLNVMVYMCNNNNLHRFGVQNFAQMASIGSNEHMNVLLQMDTLGEKSITRYHIEKDSPLIKEQHSNTDTSFSGTAENLFDFAAWGIKNFPARQQCLVLWNHGAGIKDPNIWGRMLMQWRDELFIFNEKTGLLELQRSYAHATPRALLQRAFQKYQRGIAFNEAAEAYLTNADLKNSLERISKEILEGQKIDIVAMDACHMAMVEIGSQLKNAANIMVASEEVEPGRGYRYDYILNHDKLDTITPAQFAQHIVQSYHTAYINNLADYTQSAIDLSYMAELEKYINILAQKLITVLQSTDTVAIKTLCGIRTNISLTTEFLDDDYIDFSHFLQSLVIKGPEPVHNAASTCLEILNKMILANVTGKKLPRAGGMSIYFPLYAIHPSYKKTEFAKVTAWPEFLKLFIKKRTQIFNRSAKT